MKIIKRKWKPQEADLWTKEDIIAIIISPICYALLMVGLALSCFFIKEGFIILGLGIILTWFLHWVIDPKLKAISKDYEKKQKEFLKHLDKIIKWRENE